jgi:hypothetical protein
VHEEPTPQPKGGTRNQRANYARSNADARIGKNYPAQSAEDGYAVKGYA